MVWNRMHESAIFLYIGSMEEACKGLVLDELKDPSSAQFKYVIATWKQGVSNHPTALVDLEECSGEVNAKNAFGGYVGFRKFWVEKSRAAGINLIRGIDTK
jgi:hypothetical protein